MSNREHLFNPMRFLIDGQTAAKRKRVGRRSATVQDHPFIFGPIDQVWLAQARKLGVSALWMGLALWYLKGLKKANTFLVSNILIEQWELRPDAKSRALRRLEAAGLISVERRGKRSPSVTMLGV